MNKMREPSYDAVNKDDLLKKCFNYLVNSGLESASMRKMCESTGIAMSSVYYWFKNKDGMILNSTEWGLHHVVEKLFDYIFKYIDNLQITIITFSEVAMQYRAQLRFIYQVATSLKYGDDVRSLLAREISRTCDKYAGDMAKHFNCNKNELLPYVYLFVSAVLDYVMWHDKNKMEIELSCIYNAINEITKS